jgi:regulator of replication initiation timing
MTDAKGVDGVPALGISVNANIDARRQYVFQTYVDASASVADINVTLDKVNAVIDRAVAFYQIEELENTLERDKQILYSINHNMGEVEENMRMKYEATGKRGPFKMSPQEVVQKKQAQDNVKRQTEIVSLSEKRLAEAKAKAGTRDVAPSPTDR